MIDAQQLSKMISDVFQLHSQFPKKPEKAFRKMPGNVPFGVHPVFLAMLILQEETLTEEFRVRGAKVLLGHDLLEDTNASLPEWCMEPGVKKLIDELTCPGDKDSLEEIWHHSNEAILLKFYDVVGNLLAVGAYDPQRRERRKQYAAKHLAWVKEHFPQLDIIKIAEGLIE